jgi:hypothetical protein
MIAGSVRGRAVDQHHASTCSIRVATHGPINKPGWHPPAPLELTIMTKKNPATRRGPASCVLRLDLDHSFHIQASTVTVTDTKVPGPADRAGRSNHPRRRRARCPGQQVTP